MTYSPPRIEARSTVSRGFNPATPGTEERAWSALLQQVVAWCPRPGPLLIVSPHPDDEVLGAGGLIRTWSERGHCVVVLSVTNGEAAYPDWHGLDLVRQRELDLALATLSSRPIKVARLGIPDGRVAVNAGSLLNALRKLCVFKPTIIAPFEADGHPDHEAVGLACMDVARELDLPIARYPIWAWHHGVPHAFPGARWGKFILNANTRSVKIAAVGCFKSQINPGEDREPIVPNHMLEYFTRDYEAFLI